MVNSPDSNWSLILLRLIVVFLLLPFGGGRHNVIRLHQRDISNWLLEYNIARNLYANMCIIFQWPPTRPPRLIVVFLWGDARILSSRTMLDIGRATGYGRICRRFRLTHLRTISRPWKMEIEPQYSWQAEGGISVSVDVDVARIDWRTILKCIEFWH